MSHPSPHTTASSGLKADLVIVANRLPVDRVDPADESTGGLPWRTSPGGLVAALEPVVREHHGIWVGWPGIADEMFDPFTIDGIQMVAVPLSGTEVQEYYEGFSNDTLWPLYHDVIAPPQFHREWWDAYQSINLRFAQAVAEVAAEGATVWVHDYQLQCVPQMLRDLRPDLTIGYFHHIPFPAYSIYAQLPWRDQVLSGLLGADVIGFQRNYDAGNFLTAVRRLLRLPVTATTTRAPDGRTITARAFPISIDTRPYMDLAKDPAVKARAAEIRAGLGNPQTVILGVDRLDYTKGIGHRLKAYGELLTEGQLDPRLVTLIQVASPSRERVDAYQNLRNEVELMVGRINGAVDTVEHSVIRYLHQSFPRDEMVALYLAADVLLVTSLRDGMNLVAKEYIASRIDNRGVLVLSEFTGAADELGQALQINPHDIDGLKAAILEAVNMPLTEQRRRMRLMRKRVREHDVARWSASFFQAMHRAQQSRQE